MPYTDAQARLIMARAHGWKGKKKAMSQRTARKMMADIPKKQRSGAMKKRHDTILSPGY
jgi:hypothetical protein